MRHSGNTSDLAESLKDSLDETATTATIYDPLVGTVLHELRRASGALTGLMTQQFGELGLKPSEATMLLTIGRNPGCTQSGIARTHRSKQANLVPLIAKLEREGLIVRTAGKGRIMGLATSAKGEIVLSKVCDRFERIESCLAGQLDETAVAALVQALQLVCTNACHFERPLQAGVKDCSTEY